MRRPEGRTNHEGQAGSSSRQARTAAMDGVPPAARGRRPIRRRRFGFEAMDRPRLEGDRRSADSPGCVESIGSTAHPVVVSTAMDGRMPRFTSGRGRPTRGTRAGPAWDRSPPPLRRSGGDSNGDPSIAAERTTGRLHAGVRFRLADGDRRDRAVRNPRLPGGSCRRRAERPRDRSRRSVRRLRGDGPRPRGGTRRRCGPDRP